MGNRIYIIYILIQQFYFYFYIRDIFGRELNCFLRYSQSTPAGHDYFVKESIALAQASITRSRILSASVKDMITQAVKDLKSQSISVEMALADRLNATNRACRELERTLDQVINLSFNIIYNKIRKKLFLNSLKID